jgi:Domain of unknown function (DUF4116)
MKVGVTLMSDLRARLNKIIDLHGRALSEAIGQREPTSSEAQLSPKDLVLRFADSDPTDGKSRTQWLVKTYIKDDQFKLEDLGRVDAALAAFERFKRKLPVEQRELSRFKSLRALEELVAPFVKAEARARLERDLSSATGREKRRLEEWKARDESIIIQEGKGLPTIAVPMTEFASKWWGRGTQWCTAAENNNAFMTYHRDAPLVIIVCPDGEKFQLNVKSDTFQFMDNTDKDVSEQIIQKRWSEFQSLLYWAVEQNGQTLKLIPADYQTPELCRLAVEQDGNALCDVPENKITTDLCRIALEQDGYALRYVPEKYKTPELYITAVQQRGLALYTVPEKHRTEELCRLAVAQNGRALFYVPHDLKLSRADTLQEESSFARKSSNCEEYKAGLYRLAVEKDGQALLHVPENQRTLELCRLAVEQDGLALEYVPEEYKPDFYYLAVEQNGLALKFVSEDNRTPELCRLAVEQNGQALQAVPEHKKTSELYQIAIEQDGRGLAHVPAKHRTLDLCRLAIQQHGIVLAYVPIKLRTPELCRIAVEQDGNALYAVPEELKTPELIALIPPVQPKWHLDILHGLGNQSKPQISNLNHDDGNTLIKPAY